MSQNTARPDPRPASDNEDADLPGLPPEHRRGARPRQPAGQPTGDGGAGPYEPDDGEFELVGDDDLGAADLGPIAPKVRDPDTDSGSITKITR